MTGSKSTEARGGGRAGGGGFGERGRPLPPQQHGEPAGGSPMLLTSSRALAAAPNELWRSEPGGRWAGGAAIPKGGGAYDRAIKTGGPRMPLQSGQRDSHVGRVLQGWGRGRATKQLKPQAGAWRAPQGAARVQSGGGRAAVLIWAGVQGRSPRLCAARQGAVVLLCAGVRGRSPRPSCPPGGQHGGRSRREGRGGRHTVLAARIAA